jgi:predicted PhzF superfamily epimerase YddE/YHI9
MRSVGIEMNLLQTAFAYPCSPGDGADKSLRWFTPKVEDDLCGHATLATAHAPFTDGRADGPVKSATRSGILVTDATSDGTITLDLPTAKVEQCEIPAGLVRVLVAARKRA